MCWGAGWIHAATIWYYWSMSSTPPASGTAIPTRVDLRAVTHAPAQDERNARILDATERLIAELGYDRVRLVDVADAAGVSIGSLQHRFRNRENLLRAAVDKADERERNRWLEMTQDVQEPWDRLLALLSNVLTMDRERPSDTLLLQLIAAAQSHPDLAQVLQVQQDRWALAFRQVVADGLASGRMTSELNAEETALALLALTDGFYLARRVGDRPPDLDQVRRIAEVVARRVIDVHELAV